MADLPITDEIEAHDQGIADAVDQPPEPAEEDDVDLSTLLGRAFDQHEVGGDDPEPEASEAPADEPAAPEATPPASTVAAPEHWSAADKEILERLPDDAARTAVLEWRTQIERGAQEKFEQAAHGRKLAEELDTMFAPFGVDRQGHADAIRRLVAAEQAIRQNPVQAVTAMVGGAGLAGTQQAAEFVRQLAASLGVPVGGSASQAPKDPITARLEAIEARTAQREQLERQHQQEQWQAATSAATNKIQAFATAKDANGQALHPHFEAVRSTVGALLTAAVQSGRELALDQAYEQAVWAVPELRAALQKAEADKVAELQRVEATKAAAAAAEARKQAVAKAKGARTPRTASVPVAPTDDADDLRKLLSDAFDEHLAA